MRRVGGLGSWEGAMGDLFLSGNSGTYQRTMRGFVFPRHWNEHRVVKPGFLINQGFHENLDALETGAQGPYDGDNVFLSKHRRSTSVHRQRYEIGRKPNKP